MHMLPLLFLYVYFGAHRHHQQFCYSLLRFYITKFGNFLVLGLPYWLKYKEEPLQLLFIVF